MQQVGAASRGDPLYWYVWWSLSSDEFFIYYHTVPPMLSWSSELVLLVLLARVTGKEKARICSGFAVP